MYVAISSLEYLENVGVEVLLLRSRAINLFKTANLFDMPNSNPNCLLSSMDSVKGLSISLDVVVCKVVHRLSFARWGFNDE